MKIAIYYDWLNHRWGGAERVLLDALSLFPQAPIYTLIHDPNMTGWLPSGHPVIPSFINNLPLAKNKPIIYSPLFPFAVEQFDLSSYDIVLSFTSNVGHCLLTSPKTFFIIYFFNINRHVYQIPQPTFLQKYLLRFYKNIDQIFIHRPDLYLCDSKTVQLRLKKVYKINSQVIYPGIDLGLFRPSISKNNSNYFLVVSRLVPYKKIDLAITACHQLGLSLKIVGEGSDKNRLSQMIKKYQNQQIELLGSIKEKDLISLYQNCQALICPQEEDFGLTPIESQACGRPVIAYNRGGHTESIINGKTGILFPDQSVSGLKNALIEFNRSQFSTKTCTTNALRFSRNNFMLNLKQIIQKYHV